MEGHRARKNVEPLSRGRPVRRVQGRSRVLRGIRCLPRKRRQGRRPLRGREGQTDLRRPPDQAARNEIHPRTGVPVELVRVNDRCRVVEVSVFRERLVQAPTSTTQTSPTWRWKVGSGHSSTWTPAPATVPSGRTSCRRKSRLGQAHRPHLWGEKSRGVPKTPPAEVAEVGRRPTRISCRRLCWRCHARRGPLSARAGLRRA